MVEGEGGRFVYSSLIASRPRSPFTPAGTLGGATLGPSEDRPRRQGHVQVDSMMYAGTQADRGGNTEARFAGKIT